MASIVEMAESRGGVDEEISASLIEICEAIKSGGGSAAISAAIGGLSLAPVIQNRIEVSPTPIQVEVSPTPIRVEVKVPPQPAPNIVFNAPDTMAGASWEVRLPGQFGQPDRVAQIKRLR